MAAPDGMREAKSPAAISPLELIPCLVLTLYMATLSRSLCGQMEPKWREFGNDSYDGFWELQWLSFRPRIFSESA
jgi:hypothetical protein